MADFVPHMAEQGAVRFAHRLLPPLPFHVVRLAQRQRNQPIVVAGHDVRAAAGRGIGQHIEAQACRTVLRPFRVRQVEAQKRIEQSVLGDLHPSPVLQVRRNCQIGYDTIMPARLAIRARLRHWHEPVASVVRGVGAAAQGSIPFIDGAPCGQRPPCVTVGLERQQPVRVRQIAQRVAAFLATDILEVENIAALGAGK
jgi:hypothetical protein